MHAVAKRMIVRGRLVNSCFAESAIIKMLSEAPFCFFLLTVIVDALVLFIATDADFNVVFE